MRSRSLVAPLLLSLVAFGCDDGSTDSGSDEVNDGDTTTGDETGDGDTTDTTDGGPLDSDQDGLTDEEELVLGTDPLLKDTDADNYWDSWEVIEGTDPLDAESRIYVGYWPYNPDKDSLEQARGPRRASSRARPSRATSSSTTMATWSTSTTSPTSR